MESQTKSDLRADHATRFGAPTGPDPVEAGRKGGSARRSVSFTAALREHLEKHPEDLADMVRAFVDVAKGGKAGSVEACKVALDRLDGPVSLGVDAHVAHDQTIILRVDAAGRPLPGYQHAPAMPEGLGELDDPLALAREVGVEPPEEEPEAPAAHPGSPAHAAPRGPEPRREARDPGPDSVEAVRQLFGGTVEPGREPAPRPAPPLRIPSTLAPDPAAIPPGWKPSRAEARAMRVAEARRAIEPEG